jgi:hypothetical protein
MGGFPMLHGLLMGVPFHADPTVELLPPVQHQEMVVPAKPDDPDPDHIQAIDNVFATQRDEALGAGIFALYTSSILLMDLAKEHFHLPEQHGPIPKRLPDRMNADEE